MEVELSSRALSYIMNESWSLVPRIREREEGREMREEGRERWWCMVVVVAGRLQGCR